MRRKPPNKSGQKRRFSKRAEQTELPPEEPRKRGGRGKPTGPKPKVPGGLTENQVLLYGLHTVRAALANKQRKCLRLFASQGALSRLEDGLVAKSGVEVELVEAPDLTPFVPADAVHQGAVLLCERLNVLDASELFHLADKKLVLALDQITDPHNVGAILRSAVAMGVAAVLVTSRNSAVETPVLAKSASGALDMIPLVELRNLSKGLQELADMGFTVAGLDSEGDEPLETALTAIHPTTQKTAERICLVLGSEGKGLREKTRETCTVLARLDMPGEIKSLNVSNAAALSLYIANRQLTG